MIRYLEHVGLSVRDMDRSLEFYRDLLGMQVVLDLEFPAESRLGELAGMPDAAARVVHCKLGDALIELFEYKNPRGDAIPGGRRQADLGFIHVGFSVTEIHKVHADLVSKGITFISPPVELRPAVWIAYFRGPDGEVCELRQLPDRSPV